MIVESVLEKLRELSPDKQQEVLDFVEFLRQKNGGQRPRTQLKGLCADLGTRVSEEDISQARREMWGQFPREDV